MAERFPSTTLCHIARLARGLGNDDRATAHVAVGIDGHDVLRVVTSDGPDPAIGSMVASDGGPNGAWHLITARGAEPVGVATATFGRHTVGVAVCAPDRSPLAPALGATAELAARALHGATLPQHDPLTGALAPATFFDDLGVLLEQTSRPVAAILCSVDGVESVTDSLGWEAADALLRTAYERLEGVVPRGSLISRLGNQEFAVVVDDAADAPALAEHLVAAMAQPGTAEGAELPLHASVGLSVSGADADAPTLVRQARLAARRAHRAGGGQWMCFAREWHTAATTRLAHHRDLAHALERDQLQLHFQPVVRSTATATTIVGLEALLRWRHPVRGLVPPAEFIPIAEEIGMMLPIGQWVLDEACRRHMAWQRDAPRKLGVNISATQLSSSDFVDHVHQALAHSGLPASQLVLEITETSAARDLELAADRLSQLRDLGVHVALDDFGTGYSSLTHLQVLPATMLKLDRSFVAQIGAGSEGARMAAAILGLARTLGLETVAEGVERPDQIHALRRLGCELLQGFGLHRPLPPEAVDALLAARSLDA